MRRYRAVLAIVLTSLLAGCVSSVTDPTSTTSKDDCSGYTNPGGRCD